MNNSKPYIVSFSGGRTSAYLVHLMEEKRKLFDLDVRYVFMDTGCEAEETYDFIRNVVNHYEIDLVCLRVVINPQLGQANSYKIIPIDEIKHDLVPMHDLMKKYGTPYVRGAFCTQFMKGVAANSGTTSGPFYQWAEDNFGKGNYIAVLGIRADEPKRLLGDTNYSALLKKGYTCDEAIDLKNELVALAKASGLDAVESYLSKLFSNESQQDLFNTAFEVAKTDKSAVKSLLKRIQFLASDTVIYMADLDDSERDDVLRFWRGMPFDLQIFEWLGNCVFCIKKGPNKIALAARDKPELAQKWIDLLHQSDIADKERKFGKLIMYRGDQSFEQIIETYSHLSRDELAESVRSSKQLDANSCSESCEALTCEAPFELTMQIDGHAA